MIRLSRVPPPNNLQDRLAKAFAAARAFFTLLESQRRQRRHEFNIRVLLEAKKFLHQSQNSKCGYCESLIAFPEADLEHFRPRQAARDWPPHDQRVTWPDHYWWLAYEFDNLLVICKSCNLAKRDFFPVLAPRRAHVGARWPETNSESPLLIDPIHEDPGKFLAFLRDGQVQGKGRRGEATVELLQLNRPSLVKGRLRAIAEQRQRGHGRSIPVEDDFIAARRAAFQEPVVRTPVVRTGKKADVPPEDPFQYIRTVEIENFRAIDHARIEVPPGEQGQKIGWKILLGENAAGKSTILKAIALVLLGQGHLDSLALNAADTMHRSKRGTKTSRAKSGFVKLTFANGSQNWFEFSPAGFKFRKGSHGMLGTIRGYGSMRLLPEGKEDHGAAGLAADVSNLFNPRRTLVHAEKRLLELHAKQETRFHQFAKNLKVLLRLDEDQEILAVHGRICVHLHGVPILVDELSDGYQSMFALGVDLMSGFVEDAEFEYAEGILLIDELGSHLHPRWRMEIVGRLRKTFRNLQVIATTHEPLCLVGLEEKEAVLLARGERHKLSLREEEEGKSIRGMRVDQILTSPLFGLNSTIDPVVEEDFQTYYHLLGKADLSPEENVEIDRLREVLKPHRALGYTRRDQILYDMIDSFLAEERKKSGAARVKLKDKTMRELRRLWKELPGGPV